MDGVTVNEGVFKNVRGQALSAIEVLPPPGGARCVLFWAHGHGEHCRRKLPGARAHAPYGNKVPLAE